MKTTLITATLVLCASLMGAQDQKKQQTKVRIKKVEKINGVEKVTDTLYTIDGPVTLDALDKLDGVPPLPPLPPIPPLPPNSTLSDDLIIITDKDDEVTVVGKDKTTLSKSEKNNIVIITDQVHGDNLIELTEMDEQMKNALRSLDVDGQKMEVDKIFQLSEDATPADANGKKMTTKIIIVKNIQILDPTEEDSKTVEKTSGGIDQKLKVDQMLLYPNPGNGKFNLKFDLKEKGDTEISTLNAEGKLVFNEALKNFSGSYDKEIDISNKPKGIYFVKIKQGPHSQLKKLILN